MFQYIYYSIDSEEYILEDSAFSENLRLGSWFTFDVINAYEHRHLSALNALTIFYSQRETLSNELFEPEDTWNTDLADPTRSLLCIREDLKVFTTHDPANKFINYYCRLIHRFSKFSSLYSGCEHSSSILKLYKNKLSTYRH